jgi:hypothetical protein
MHLALRTPPVIVLLLLEVTCTGTRTGPPPSSSGIQSDRASPSQGQPHLSTPCPTTQPVSRRDTPRPVVDAVLGDYRGPRVQNLGAWFGNDALWVELPSNGNVVKRAGERLDEKFPWVRLVRGAISITGRRLDGPAPPARGHASTGDGPIGFNSSGIFFPTEGCWEITGSIHRSQLTFVVRVHRRASPS